MTNISRLLSVAVALGVHHAPLHAQAPAAAPIASAAMPVPFAVGERLDYDVKFGPMHVGGGSMEVLGNENVRNRPTWHIMFRVKGGTFFYKVDDRFESWIETTTLSSLRHKQDINEGRRDRERTFEIYPDRPSYIEDDKPEKPSVGQPLDDGSFLYFIRTVPLEVGKTYEFDRYFRPDRNPVKITVLRKEKIKVPAGTFDAIVIRPSIKSKGIFSENGQAEVWLSDDDRHIMLQMKSKLSFGSLNLYLKSYRPPPSQAQ
ncbi:MAG TPA: DUF3108 domain-containing protein [Gemmatimonadaceae bacterium]|nr:DUF3108 domain-containing protein [Gemmatimonadaceae bacterium]